MPKLLLLKPVRPAEGEQEDAAAVEVQRQESVAFEIREEKKVAFEKPMEKSVASERPKEESVALAVQQEETVTAAAPDVTNMPLDVPIQVIPTPKKRMARPVPAEEQTAIPPETKPLKVIRKRKEEAPKIFETVPRPVPQAMLEGIEVPREELGGKWK